MTITDASLPIDRFRRPNRAWFPVIHGGLSAMAAMSLSQSVYDAVATRIPVPPRKVVQFVWVSTAVVHVAEAAVAYRTARAHGMNDSASRWARETLFLGFPVLLELKAVTEGR